MIYLVSSCTNSKKIAPEKHMTINNFSDQLHLENVINEWKNRIKQHPKEALHKAKDLYKGGSWKATLNTFKTLSEYDQTTLLIASAGYGLINSEKPIAAYDCTFAFNTENSVSKFHSISFSNMLWWDNINDFSLKDLNANANVFIVLPYDYLIATQNTIQKFIQKFGNRLFIFTANKRSLPHFMIPFQIKFDDRFHSIDKGVVSNRLQRTVQWLSTEISIKKLPIHHKSLQNHIDSVLENFEAIPTPKRQKISDEELKRHIQTMILENADLSASSGLRQLRDKGFACEQKKFGNLFRYIKSELACNH